MCVQVAGAAARPADRLHGWLGLYAPSQLARLESGQPAGVLRIAVRSAASIKAPVTGHIEVSATADGLSAVVATASARWPLVPDLFDADWGYGPWFHQTILQRQDSWFRLALDGLPGDSWVDTAGWATNVREVEVGDILATPRGDVVVLAVDAQGLQVRPEQPADMWCRHPEPAPPMQALEPRRWPLATLFSKSGHLQMRVKYTRGC